MNPHCALLRVVCDWGCSIRLTLVYFYFSVIGIGYSQQPLYHANAGRQLSHSTPISPGNSFSILKLKNASGCMGTASRAGSYQWSPCRLLAAMKMFKRLPYVPPALAAHS